MASLSALARNLAEGEALRLACAPTGGENQKAPLPSCVGDPTLSPWVPSYSAPVSSTAVTRKHGAISGQYSSTIQGCPYSLDPSAPADPLAAVTVRIPRHHPIRPLLCNAW